MKKRVYKPAFKSETVKLSYERENIKELAEELGVDVQRIYKWRKDSKKEIPLSNTKTTTITISEYKKVQKQLKDTQLELEILKKAIHIFSKKDGSITNS